MITNLNNPLLFRDTANGSTHFRFPSDVVFVALSASGLLQNPIAAETTPTTPAEGDMWLDLSGTAAGDAATTAGVWRQYDGTAFVAAPTLQSQFDALDTLTSIGAADIAARDALTVQPGDLVYVMDASADPTVDAGAALYRRNDANTGYDKLTEFESLDVSVAAPTQLAVV